ncbi:MAG: hypothetical protein OEY03_09710 [Rhizobacter sp.]|nr:hypothetical protein [Rhizobacter sp.]
MKLQPFSQADDIRFSVNPQQLIHRLGPPLRRERNGVGLDELDYGHRVVRFQDSGRFEEVTRRTPVLHLGELAVPFGALQGFITAQDAAAFERAGFIVSPRYGIAFAPESPDWVTALAAHCIPAWRAL